ncbi:TolC family protein [Epilithonimonas lactis]|uniref:Transporter n=1 Tax=Epilithonimonas lactis TaxID=421072 RepID=A0A085BJQ2_9FLAO|nr:TolC family protein [Epilithonimonas lactis]KFC22697.1 transporter [Epilithonimonas lactis]SEQ84766.1 outer membrane protein, cobalt-zinc-cadmium efflux system [Epilithonimonas lactis]
MNKITTLVLSVSAFVCLSGQQQMSLQDCELAFQKNNLQVLAAQYNINMADADIIQAKIWELPQISGYVNAYNPEDKRAFDVGRAKGAEITQLIYLGGKKKNEIQFAKSNKELSQLQFNQLLVDLRSQLRETYYNLIYEQKKQISIDGQLKYMNELLAAYKIQTDKGNISLKDYVRLQSIVIQLNNDKIEINNNILAFQQNMKILTGNSNNILPNISKLDENDILISQPFGDLEILKEKALVNNADYLYNLRLIENSKLFAQWQKSLNTPDLNLGAEYDQNSGTFRNEINLKVGIPIPLWKVNKGNVEKAKYAIQQNEKNSEYQKLNLETQVESAYQTWKNQYDQYFELKPVDVENLNTVYNGILKNFRSGNISLMDFTDFLESYRQTVLQIYEMKKQIMISAEQLNQLVQTKIFY